jgi:RND family efflux transporter MFP subunit
MQTSTKQDEAEPDKSGWIGWLQIAAIIAIIIVAMMMTAVLSSGGGREPQAAPERAATPVQTIRPAPAAHQVEIALTGSVASPSDVTLTPQVSGRVIEVSEAVRAGAHFEPNEVLFLIDPRDYEVAVSRAQASLADAQSALQQLEAEAEINRAEWRRQYPNREITPLAAREPQLSAARARVASAQADLSQARLNLERTAISFPFRGRVIESRVEAGQLVSAGQSYGSVYDIARLEIIAPIAPADLERLTPAVGRQADLTVGESALTLQGEIVREGASLDARTRFIDLFIEPASADALRPGQFVDVRISGPDLDESVMAPASALAGLNQVRIVREGRIAEVEVIVLDRVGDQVFLRPFDFGEGVIITPVPENALGRRANILSGDEAAQ